MLFQRQRPGVVVDIRAALGHDHRQLAGERCIAQGCSGHGVSHGFQGDLQPAGWQGQWKDRGIFLGECIRVTAEAGHQGRILPAGEFAAAFEQQMLQGMGKACVAVRFVARTYVIPQLHADQRGSVVFAQVDAQAIGEGEELYRRWVLGHG
ncbi:hypothetical protein D3C81_1268920 [compost metagenome]